MADDIPPVPDFDAIAAAQQIMGAANLTPFAKILRQWYDACTLAGFDEAQSLWLTAQFMLYQLRAAARPKPTPSAF